MKILIANPVDVTGNFVKSLIRRDFPEAVFFLEETAAGALRILQREEINVLVTEMSFHTGLERATGNIHFEDTLNGSHVLRAAKDTGVSVRVVMCFLLNPRQKIEGSDLIEIALVSGAEIVICPPHAHLDVGEVVKKLINGGGKV